jgi:predicted dehydrogenase
MINVAVIGLGRWGQGIVRAIQSSSKRLRVVRAVTLEPELSAEFAKAQNFELSTDFEATIRDPKVDAVMLATPHLAHVDQIIAVANLKKPVWCEKPLALSSSEARRAIDAVRKAGVVMGLGNNKRYYPSMRELKRIVAAGEIGEVLHVEGHFTNEHSTSVAGGWRDDPRQSPGMGMTGAGLHVLDSIVNLAGPIVRVDARVFSQKAPPDPRDVIAVLTQSKSGATGQLATVRAGPVYWRMHVFGTLGWAEARDETTLTVALMKQAAQVRQLPQADGLTDLIEAFAAAIEGGAPFPVTTAQMLDTVGAFEAVITSIGSGKPVDVRLD